MPELEWGWKLGLVRVDAFEVDGLWEGANVLEGYE